MGDPQQEQALSTVKLHMQLAQDSENLKEAIWWELGGHVGLAGWPAH